MRHPNGGPPLALRLDPDRAQAAAGFDYEPEPGQVTTIHDPRETSERRERANA